MQIDLESEVRRGNNAQIAYDVYLKIFIKECKEQIIDAFFLTPFEDADKIMDIKRLSIAVESLEIRILQDIETGNLAAYQLAQKNGD